MISVIYLKVIKKINPNISCDGKINLRGLFGRPVNANLVAGFVKSFNCSTKFIPVVVAMTLFANTDLILTDQFAQALLSSRDNECNFSIAADFRVHNDVVTNTSYDTNTNKSENDSNTKQLPSQHKKHTVKSSNNETIASKTKTRCNIIWQLGTSRKKQKWLLYPRWLVVS